VCKIDAFFSVDLFTKDEAVGSLFVAGGEKEDGRVAGPAELLHGCNVFKRQNVVFLREHRRVGFAQFELEI
jgi:hypothetical protein